MKYEKEFAKYLEKERGSSRSTASAYLSDASEFCRYMEEKGKAMETAEKADVSAFLNRLKEEGRSGATVNRKLASVRSYYTFLRAAGKSDADPTFGIKAPKQQRKELEFLTVEEVDRLLEMPGDDARGKRDRALLEMMYATGMKASEACAVNTGDINLRIGFVSCSGESGKARIIPLGKPARQAIKVYLDEARPELLGKTKDCGALFLNYMGERLTRQGVWKLLRHYGEKAGLSKTMNPLILRNSFAAHMIQNGADLKSLQELLGHEDITATKVFLALSKNRIMDVYDKAFPRA
ncbi:MAG: tyrosine-type recombinase/integrase [Clostridia bacterium]|nr:tyrosine-type recombinase/integrase [Clostridia bacterium]